MPDVGFRTLDSKYVLEITFRLCSSSIYRAPGFHWPNLAISSGRRANVNLNMAAAIRLIQSNFIKWKTTATKIRPFIFHITLAIFLCIATHKQTRTHSRPTSPNPNLRRFASQHFNFCSDKMRYPLASTRVCAVRIGGAEEGEWNWMFAHKFYKVALKVKRYHL